MDEVILNSKALIKAQVKKRKILIPDGFGEDSKAYAATNENINGYMNILQFRGNDKVFSVLGSGDQSFNAILNGASDIDTFDTCPLTEYFALGIKRSAIIAFSYQDFLKFSRRIVDPNISLDELASYIEFLFPYMEKKYQDYWREIIDYNFKIQKWHYKKMNLMQMLLINTRGLFVNTFKNTYLKSEEEYNILRSRIGQANISFTKMNIFNYKGNSDKKYDFIFLSNILDYFYEFLGHNNCLMELIAFKNRLSSVLNADGVMCFAYLAYFGLNDGVNIKLLDDVELHFIPHISNNKEQENIKDAVILVRKK